MLSLYLAIIDTEEEKARFTALYDEYKNLMFHIAWEILHDEHLSEDAVQEAFLRIAKNFHKIKEVSCPQTRNFAVIITRNAALTILGQRKNASDLGDYTEQSALTASDDVFSEVSSRLLAEYILKLPTDYRDPLYLHHLYGYSIGEVAGLLSLSVEATKKRVQRARTMLKKMLEKENL